MTQENSKISADDCAVLFGVGDVGPLRPRMDTMFNSVAPVLRGGDLVFGQLETTVSARGSRAPNAKLAIRTRPDAAAAIRETGFTHMSFAGNHCLDWGYEAFDDTFEHMRSAGVELFGAGSNLEAARRAALAEVKGMRVALLGYSSILPQGYRAQATRPGCAPLWAHTKYEQVELDQPGTPCRVQTYADRQDLEAALEDIAKARESADLVVLSVHWGVHFVPEAIADYQREIAHAAVDAGVDLILGHHPHILKGVEVYRGKPIFYSLGNFAIEHPWVFERDIRETESFRDISKLGSGWSNAGEYGLPSDTRKSVIVRCELKGGEIWRTSVLPVYLSDNSEPQLLKPDNPQFYEVTRYLESISKSQAFDTQFRLAGSEVEIS